MSVAPSSAAPNLGATWFRRALGALGATFTVVVVVMLALVKQQRDLEWEAGSALAARGDAEVHFLPHPSAAWMSWIGASREFPPMDDKGAYAAACASDPRALFDRVCWVRLRRTVRDPAALRRLADCPLLQALFARECSFTPQSWEALAACKQVPWLQLPGGGLESCDLGLLRGNDRLEVLDLAANGLTDDRLAPVSDMQGLESLRVDLNPLRGRFLESPAAWPKLKSLSVCATPFDDAGATALIRSRPNLVVFQGRRCLVTDASAAGFGSMAKLVSLNLNETIVGDEAARGIARSKSLWQLRLGRTLVTGEGFLPLAAIPTLRLLHVYQTQVTEEEVDRFQKLRPDVKILGPGHEPSADDLQWSQQGPQRPSR